jgi:hypothetical protein
MVVAKGLGGAFLKTLSICPGRCVVSYLEFEIIQVKSNSEFRRKLRYLPTAEHFLFCETGSFGKASFAPRFTPHSSLLSRRGRVPPGSSNDTLLLSLTTGGVKSCSCL